MELKYIQQHSILPWILGVKSTKKEGKLKTGFVKSQFS